MLQVYGDLGIQSRSSFAASRAHAVGVRASVKLRYSKLVRGMKRMNVQRHEAQLSFVMAWIAPPMLCCPCQCVDMRACVCRSM